MAAGALHDGLKQGFSGPTISVFIAADTFNHCYSEVMWVVDETGRVVRHEKTSLLATII
ncbi:MAG: hypothetical protein OXS28_22210 [Gammaproteobacteria bacterium]|nr:hypothetical protein [Gammaproteobacteria bacterium]